MVREGMRGADHQQNHMFSYLSPEMRVRKDHPLRAIRAMVDEVLTQYQSVHRKNQERQVGLWAVKDCSSVPGYSEEILLLSEEDILGLDLSRRHVVSKLMTG